MSMIDTVPPFENLLVSFFFLCFTCISLLCLCIVTLERKLSVSLQRDLFALLTLHASLRCTQNLFSFIEKLISGSDGHTPLVIAQISNSMDFIAVVIIFAIYMLLALYWCQQWYLFRLYDWSARNSSTAAVTTRTSLLQDPHNADSDADTEGDQLKTGSSTDHTKGTTGGFLTADTMHNLHLVQQRKEHRIKRNITAVFWFLTRLMMMCALLIISVFVVLQLDTRHLPFRLARLCFRLLVSASIVLSMLYYGIRLYVLYRSKLHNVGDALKQVALVTFVSISIFIFLSVFNILTTVLYENFEAPTYPFKWLIFLIQSLLELLANGFLLIQFRPRHTHLLMSRFSSHPVGSILLKCYGYLMCLSRDSLNLDSFIAPSDDIEWSISRLNDNINNDDDNVYTYDDEEEFYY